MEKALSTEVFSSGDGGLLISSPGQVPGPIPPERSQDIENKPGEEPLGRGLLGCAGLGGRGLKIVS